MAIQSIFPRATMIFTFGRKSWSESHYMVTSDGATTPGAIKAAFAPVLAARLQLLGLGITNTANKYSIDGQNRVFEVDSGTPPSFTLQLQPYYNLQWTTQDTADANVALLVKSDSPGFQYHKHIFLAGLPLAVSQELSGFDPVMDADFLKALNVYEAALQLDWGFRVSAQGADNPQFKIQSIAFGVNTATITLQPGQVGALPGAGAVVKIGRVVTTSSAIVNGVFAVTASSAGPPQTITVTMPGANNNIIAEFNTGFIRANVHGVVPYGVFATGGIVTRKRGVGYDPPRGRSRRKKVSL